MQFFPLKTRTHTYGLAHFLADFYFYRILQGEAKGIDNVPKEGPVLIAGNHLSFWDPPLFGGIIPRESYFFARNSLFKPGFIENRLHELNAIPVKRDDDSDVSALKKTLKVLKEGNALIYFPEGTRSKNGELQKAKSGIGLIACKTEVPVVPARIFNSHSIRDRHGRNVPISITYGPCLYPKDYDPGTQSKNRYQEAADFIMGKIQDLTPNNPEII